MTFKTLFRSLLRHKFFFYSTVFGFAISLGICVLASSFYFYETSTDDFVTSDLYRVQMADPISLKRQAVTYHELPQKISGYADVVSVTHFFYDGYQVTTTEDGREEWLEKGIIYADTNFLQIFNFDLLYGDKATCLISPNNVVLTEDQALKYFGTVQALTEVLVISGQQYQVTGVLRSPPNNSHIKLSILISYASLRPAKRALDYGGFTYVKLKNGASAGLFEKKLNTHPKNLLSYNAINWPIEPFTLESIKDAYYHDQYETYLLEIFRTRERSTVITYAVIASTLFFVACMNFILYFYSKTSGNLKPHLIRKVLGETPLQALFKYAFESGGIMIVSLLLGLALTFIALPYFNTWSSSSVPYTYIINPKVLLTLVIGICIASILLGLIFYKLFKSISISNAFATTGKGFSKENIIRSLVVTQLTVAVCLLLLFAMIRDQLNGITNYSLGYDQENLIELDLSRFNQDFNPQTLKSELLKLHRIKSASVSVGGPMTGRWSRTITFNGIPTDLGFYQADADFIKTMKIEMLRGEDFKNYTSNDSAYMIFNETGANFFDIDKLDSLREDLPIAGKVLGIFKDFHYASLKERVSPTFIQYAPFTKIGPFGARMLIRADELDESVISAITSVWKSFEPDHLPQYSIVKEEYSSLYQEKHNEAKLLSITVIGVLAVTCLGIIGFSSFVAEKRMKEIAIRKVLGARARNIYLLWSKTFFPAIVIAFIVSIPITYYIIGEWSSVYVYKSDVSLITIPVTLLITVTIILLSAFYYINKATRINPADVLKHE